MKVAWRTLYGLVIFLGIGAGMLKTPTPGFVDFILGWPACPDWLVFLVLFAFLSFPPFLASGILVHRTGDRSTPWIRMVACSAGAAVAVGTVVAALDLMSRYIGDERAGWIGFGIVCLTLPLAWCGFWAMRAQART